jgi:hypothetical protein
MEPPGGDRFSEHSSTNWTMLHDGFITPEGQGRAGEARRQFIGRYERASRAYLGALLRGEPDAEEAVGDCFQDLMVKFCDGGLAKLSPEPGGRSATTSRRRCGTPPTTTAAGRSAAARS